MMSLKTTPPDDVRAAIFSFSALLLVKAYTASGFSLFVFNGERSNSTTHGHMCYITYIRSGRNKDQKLVGRFLKIGHFCKLLPSH